MERPYENLVPIVDALVAAGNTTVTRGFVNSQGGFYCQLAKPIDFDVVAREFELPASISLAPEYDTILDKLSWVAIIGAAADILNTA
jgi:hypothetical protein